MKKFISMLLALVMVFVLTACGSAPEATEEPTDAPVVDATDAPVVDATDAPVEDATDAPVEDEPAAPQTGVLEELLNQVITEQPVEFMGGSIPVDVTDSSEDGLANLKYFTGLDTAEQISEAAVYEPMMGSIPFSMVMVKVNEGADAEAVAEAMKGGIDPRKWICVEAEEVMVAGSGDVVMLIMCNGAQSFVDAFQTVRGGELDFVI